MSSATSVKFFSDELDRWHMRMPPVAGTAKVMGSFRRWRWERIVIAQCGGDYHLLDAMFRAGL